MRKLTISIILIIIVLSLYGRFIEPYWFHVNHLQVNQPHLNQLLAGRTAIHLTDLHFQQNNKQAERLLQIITALEPDFIFLTGDYVTWAGPYQPAFDFLEKLQATAGTWAVMGDYDYSNDRKSCLFCHDAGNGKPATTHRVSFLRNSAVNFEIEGQSLYIVGIEWYPDKDMDGHNGGGWPDLPGESAVVVLTHSPLAFATVPENYNALVLAGDTHGGQIYLPGWAWALLGYEKNRKYNRGWFQQGDSQMYVSRGLGTSHITFRLGCRPEITVLHF